MKSFKIILLLVTGILSWFTVSQCSGKNMSPLQNKPYFTLNIDSFGTSYFLDINGISIHSEYDSTGQMATSFPVNHLMRSGKNILEIYILPEEIGEPLSKNGRVEATLYVEPNDETGQKILISSIKYEGKASSTDLSVSHSLPSGKFDSASGMTKSEQGDITVNDIKISDVPEYKGAIYISREINIPSTLPLWTFFNSDDLPDYINMNDEDYYKNIGILLVEYLKVQNALKTGDIEKVLPLFEERNKELDAAFYHQPGTMENKIKKSLLNSATNKDLELVDLETKYLNFTIERNNKLTSLTRDRQKNAIALNFKSSIGGVNYSLIFRQQNGKWILTR